MDTIRGPLLTCVQQVSEASSEDNTGHEMDKGLKFRKSSTYIQWNNSPAEKNLTLESGIEAGTPW